MKKKFLVIDDYQHGAAVAFVYAESRDKIKRMFPSYDVFDLEVDKIPAWLTGAEDTVLITDIDDLSGWLKLAIENKGN